MIKEEFLERSGAKCLCWPLLLRPCSVGHIHLPYRRRKGNPEGLLGTSPSLSHSLVLWWERVAALGCLLGNEWTGQHLPAPWLNPRCLMLLSDVVCTLPKMLQLLDPKNREFSLLRQENITESCWFAIMLLRHGCYPEKLKFLSPLGLVVKWMAKPQSVQEQKTWDFIQVGVSFSFQKCDETTSCAVIKQHLYLSVTVPLTLLCTQTNIHIGPQSSTEKQNQTLTKIPTNLLWNHFGQASLI